VVPISLFGESAFVEVVGEADVLPLVLPISLFGGSVFGEVGGETTGPPTGRYAGGEATIMTGNGAAVITSPPGVSFSSPYDGWLFSKIFPP
jgi:hypothetical protein